MSGTLTAPRDEAALANYAAPFRVRGGRVMFVELDATQDERLRRNSSELRLREKPSKLGDERSAALLRDLDNTHRLNTRGELDARSDWLKIENTTTPAVVAASRIVTHFGLAP
jgi:hypothetical protein